jgi:hypothetical protein
MTRIRKVSAEEWKYRILNAVLLDTPPHQRKRDMRRANKARRKSVRAYRNPSKILGNCYENAYQALFDGQHDEWTLVHGRPTLTVEPFIEFGHAWLEDPDEVWVYDAETKNYLKLEHYYACGQIDPAKCHKYTKLDAVRWGCKTRHYGPWEGPDAVGVWSKKAHRKYNKQVLASLEKPLKVTGKLGKTVEGFKHNPTPLLRKVRAKARAWIQQEGSWQKALNKAMRLERDRHFRLGRLMRRELYRIRDEEAVKPNKQQSPKIIKRKKIVRTTQAMYERLLEEFGTTNAMSARGFILEDGQCLNLGQYDDHRIINTVYADTDAAEERFGSRYGAFANLCRKFNMIRWIPEPKSVEIFVPTTRYQDETLRDLVDAGMLREAEVHKPRGGTVMLEAEDGEALVRGINAILG